MKKTKLIRGLKLSLAFILATSMSVGLAGCGEETVVQDESGITVVSREEGSGTRNAFVELTGVMKDNVDKTTDKAEISNSNSVVIKSVWGNDGAIGYTSMGSTPSGVKAIQINGIEPTAENVASGQYELQRPFNLVTMGQVDKLPQDFIDFVLSDEGQKIIKNEGFVPVNASGETYAKSAQNDSSSIAKSIEPSAIQSTPYTTKSLEGTITIAGSTSVAPVMENLVAEYKKLNENVNIEIQQIGSAAGIQSAIQGTADIAMTSRDLTQDEMVEGIASTRIALDGIAVIVNTNNEINNLTKEELMKIFTGEITQWSELQKSSNAN